MPTRAAMISCASVPEGVGAAEAKSVRVMLSRPLEVATVRPLRQVVCCVRRAGAGTICHPGGAHGSD
jgi:hypothetical protein